MMRLFFILDETGFFHPDFFARFLDRTPDDVVGLGRVTAVPAKSDIERYMLRHPGYLRPGEILRLGAGKVRGMVLDRCAPKRKGGRFHSVRAVARCYGIDHFDIRKTVNTPACRERIAAYGPDIIVSSNSLYFGKKLLALPKTACINRHSGLLPAYGGVWPVFQAVRSGEAETGVSVHLMEPGIDEGAVLARRTVPIGADDTVNDLYARCFSESVDAVLEAVERLRTGDRTPLPGAYEPSYYSFPSKAHWDEFRSRGRRFA